MATDSTLVEVEPTKEHEFNAGLISVVTEGQPFVLLRVNAGTDNDGPYVEVGVMSDMPMPIIAAALSVAYEQVVAKLKEDSEQGE